MIERGESAARLRGLPVGHIVVSLETLEKIEWKLQQLDDNQDAASQGKPDA